MYQTDSFKTSVTAVKAACTCKLLQLLQLLPDRWMIRLIMELIGNRSFTLTAANGKRVGYDASRIASHTGIRTGTLLFIIYTSDLSTARPRKYAWYTNDLPIMHAELKLTNSEWGAKQSSVGSLPLQQQGRQMWTESQPQRCNHVLLLRAQEPRSNVGQDTHIPPTPRVTSQKLTSRCALLRRLADSGWGARATTLRPATLALVHLTAKYWLPVWCRSAHTRGPCY